MFGRQIQGEQVAWWGARAIYQGYNHDYYIDLLPDRQGGENVSDEFLLWLNKRAMPWLRQRVKEIALSTDDPQVLTLDEFKFHLEASTNGSYGYLYVGAVERPVPRTGEHHNDARNTMEPVFTCDGKTYVYPYAEIPTVGTTGAVTVNRIGKGTVVGYQSEKYGDSGHLLLNLRVALDEPPTWWKKQTFQTELERAMKEHIVAQKSKFVGVGIRRSLKPTGEPEKESLKQFKANYKEPPLICWGDSFKVETPVPA